MKRLSTFEIFGLDFMLDEAFKVYLIEVNTNPSFDLCCPLLERLIPEMIDDSFRIVVDPMFPPPANFSSLSSKKDLCPQNKYELIFDEKIDGPELQPLIDDHQKSKE